MGNENEKKPLDRSKFKRTPTKEQIESQTEHPPISDDSERIVIALKNKNVCLTVLAFDPTMSVDDILRIDFHNVMGEILTFPVLYNRISNMKAEMENIVTMAEMDFKIFEAQLTNELQKKLAANAEKKPTIKDVESAVLVDARYLIKYKELADRQKQLGYLISLEKSAAKKIAFLEKIAFTIKPSEFEGELLQDTVNGVLIKQTKKFL